MAAASTQPLTKPADWTQYLIDAALKLHEFNDLPMTYVSEDAGKLNVMKSLNFLEAHNQYDWPDFDTLGLDFAQIMKLRRALVNDVYVALLRNGNFRIGVNVGSPESVDGRKGTSSQGRQSRKKRLCRRNDSVPDDNSFEDGTENDEDAYLAQIMRDLMRRSAVDGMEEWLKLRENPLALANLIHDGLVAQWDRPQVAYVNAPVALQEKIRRWAGATIIPASRLGTPMTVKESIEQCSSPELGSRSKAVVANMSSGSTGTVRNT